AIAPASGRPYRRLPLRVLPLLTGGVPTGTALVADYPRGRLPAPAAIWPPLAGALAIADHLCKGLVVSGHPCSWLGRGRSPLQLAWPWPATPQLVGNAIIAANRIV
ncbi:hypothetical protein BHE74_00059320, partial [Ensete ventricosum]